MNWADIAAFIFTLPALFLMGRKDKRCFYLFTITNMLFLYVGIDKDLPGLVGMCCVYIIFNVRNYFMWRKQEREYEEG